jgi:hypothetical protein
VNIDYHDLDDNYLALFFQSEAKKKLNKERRSSKASKASKGSKGSKADLHEELSEVRFLQLFPCWPFV